MKRVFSYVIVMMLGLYDNRDFHAITHSKITGERSKERDCEGKNYSFGERVFSSR
jgi:hypothetical protein